MRAYKQDRTRNSVGSRAAQVFEPLILALEGKAICREKIIRLIRVSHIVADETGFRAHATSLERIEAWGLDCLPLFEFDFGVCWKEIRFVGRCIVGYNIWIIYTDSELVSQVMALLDSPQRPNPKIRKLLDDYMNGA